jgi:hypothetical protein
MRSTHRNSPLPLWLQPRSDKSARDSSTLANNMGPLRGNNDGLVPIHQGKRSSSSDASASRVVADEVSPTKHKRTKVAEHESITQQMTPRELKLKDENELLQKQLNKSDQEVERLHRQVERLTGMVERLIQAKKT